MAAINPKTLKKALIIVGLGLFVFFSLFTLVHAVSVFLVQQGGTGTTTAPVSQVFYGGANGAYQSVATTTLTAGTNVSYSGGTPTIIGGTPITINVTGNPAGLATTSPWTQGNVAYVTDDGHVSSVATGTISISGGLTVTAGRSVLGGAATIGCTAASRTATGCLTAANFTTFFSKVGTSSNATAGNLAYYTTTNGTPALIGDVATGTVSNGTGISVTAGQAIIGSGLTITNTSPLSALTTAFPLSITGTVLSWIGLATTSNPSAGNIFYSNGTTGLIPIATTSLTMSGPFQVPSVLGALIGGAGAVTWDGLATTSQPGSSNVLTSNGGAGVYGTATSSIGAGTGLSFSGTAGAQVGGTNGTYSVNTSQNIATLSNLTTNGYVKTSGGAGTLGVQAVPIPIADGGTGSTTAPVSQLIYGGSNASYQSVATSSTGTASTVLFLDANTHTVIPTASSTAFSSSYASSTNGFFGTLNLPNISSTQCLHSISGVVSGTGVDCGSGSGGSIATTSNLAQGKLAFYSSVTPTILDAVATTSLSVSGPFQIPSALGALVGGAGNITWDGLATTSQPSSSNLLTSNGGAGVYGTATSTLNASSPLTGSFTQVGSGGSLGLGTVGIANGGTATTTGGVTNGVEFWNGSTLTNDASFIHLSGGNVGIGTTTPFSSLSVSTTTQSNGASSLFAVASTTNATLFNVLGNGNVGVGSTSPTQTLSVNGNGWFSGNALHVGDTADNLLGGPCTADAKTCFELVGNDNTTAGVTSIIENTNAGASAYSDLFFANSNTMSGGVITNYGVLNYNSHAYNDNTFGTAFNVPDQLALYGNNGPTLIGAVGASGYINFVTGGSATANERARITSAGLVGIGTSTPTTLLELYGTNNGTGLTGITNGIKAAITNKSQTVNSNEAVAFRTEDANGAATTSAQISGINTDHTANLASGALAFHTLNAGTLSERMRILSTGEVGINTTAPTALLHLAGTYTTANASNVILGGTLASSNTGNQSALNNSTTFTPTGASVNSISGYSGTYTVNSSAAPITTFQGNTQTLNLGSTYTGGTIANGRTYSATQITVQAGGPFITNFDQYFCGGITLNGDGLTSGTVTNNCYRNGSLTASSSAGGTVNNRVMTATVPSGSPNGGTTNNRGIYITGNGGVSDNGGTAINFALYSDSTAPSQLTGGLTLDDTTITSGGFKNNLWVATTSVTQSQVGLRSARAAIVAGNVIGGIDFWSDDTNLTAPGTTTASFQALANETHTAATQGTDLAFFTSATGGTATNTEKVRITGAGLVGVATSTPTNLLTLSGAGTSNQIALYDTGAASTQQEGTLGFVRGSLIYNTHSSQTSATTTRLSIDPNGALMLGAQTITPNTTGGDGVFNAAPGYGTGTSGALRFFTAPTSSVSTIAFNASSTNSTATFTTTLALSHTIGSGSNRILVCQDSTNSNVATRVTGVDLGGVQLTRIASSVGANGETAEFWYLINPASGAGTITFTSDTTSVNLSAQCADFTGVDQTTPFGSPVTSNGTSLTTTGYQTTPTAVGEWVLDSVGKRSGLSTEQPFIKGDSTMVTIATTTSSTAAAGTMSGFSYTIATTTSAFTDWNWTSSGNSRGFNHVTVSMREAGDSTLNTLAERLTILPNGNIGVGSTTPGSLLSIGGNTTGTNFYDNATTTKSGIGGYNITGGGCYAVNGTCIGAGSAGGSGTVSTSTALVSGQVDVSTGVNTIGNFSGFTYDVANSTGQLSIPSNGWYGIGGSLLGYASSTNHATIFGLQAGGQNATTSATTEETTAVGYTALTSLTTGLDNTAVGSNALFKNTTGADNTAIGFDALTTNTTGNSNVAIGSNAGVCGNGVYTGDTFIGFQANENCNGLPLFTTALGYESGFKNIGWDNDFYGEFAGQNVTTGNHNLVIGWNALAPSASASNQLAIANYLYGTMPATTSVATFSLPTSGSFSVGSSSPYAKFAIQTNNGDTATTLFAIGSSTSAATTTLFNVQNTGNVGIGTSSPWRTLSVTGTISVSGLTAASALQTSDVCLNSSNDMTADSVLCVASAARFKQNVQPLGSTLDEINKMAPVSFYWKPDFNGNLQSNPNYSGEQVGLIADSLQKIDPRLITVETAPTVFEGVNYPAGSAHGLNLEAIAGLTIQGIKDQQQEISVLQKQVDTLSEGKFVRSVEENWQDGLIGLLFMWCLYLTFRKR